MITLKNLWTLNLPFGLNIDCREEDNEGKPMFRKHWLRQVLEVRLGNYTLGFWRA